ncbi:uncharacterized protein VTP21DRAFT_6327 [Calcarisporiella thermophila]|uniref:uncharacterized protein n=1 Tax=Calcarisporiella thermophila TaxID=911321 RepID=UPI003743AC84
MQLFYLLYCLIYFTIADTKSLPQIPFDIINSGTGVWDDCGKNETTIHSQSVALTPFPPFRGQDLEILWNGSTDSLIDETYTANISIQLGAVILFNQPKILCEEIGRWDLQCPLRKGNYEIKERLGVPISAPPGHYRLRVLITTENVTAGCLNIQFQL